MALAKVNLGADRSAFLVHLLTVHVAAIFRATSGKQVLLCWLLQQHIHITFNLLLLHANLLTVAACPARLV